MCGRPWTRRAFDCITFSPGSSRGPVASFRVGSASEMVGEPNLSLFLQGIVQGEAAILAVEVPKQRWYRWA